MSIYRRLTHEELEALPLEQQAEARAFDAYLDAARRKAPLDELQLLGLLLELAILSGEPQEKIDESRDDQLEETLC